MTKNFIKKKIMGMNYSPTFNYIHFFCKIAMEHSNKKEVFEFNDNTPSQDELVLHSTVSLTTFFCLFI